MLLFVLLQICGLAFANSPGEMAPSPQNDEMNVGGSIGADQQTSRATSPTLMQPASVSTTTMTTTRLTTVRETPRPPPAITSTHWSTVYATTTEVLPSHPTTVTATRTITLPKTVTVTPFRPTTHTTHWLTIYNTTTSTLPPIWKTETITSYLIRPTTLYSKLSMSLFALYYSVMSGTLYAVCETTETNQYVYKQLRQNPGLDAQPIFPPNT